jgi:hypothetical protein
MKAKIISFNRAINHYEATTDNDIALSFSVLGDDHLKLNEILEIDLPRVVAIQQLIRISDGNIIQIKIGEHDLHDLKLPMAHGKSRIPSRERLEGEA